MAYRQGAHGLIAALLLAEAALADPLRIATFNTALSRDRAGALIREVEAGDEAPRAVAAIIAEVAPDIILLNEFDHDGAGRGLAAFQALLEEAGHPMPHRFSAPVNSGEPTGLDLDDDGGTGDPDEAQGWGRWPGHYGMAVLSRHPIAGARTFREAIWAEQPDSLSIDDGALAEVQRLSSKSHWDVEIEVGGIPLHLIALHPTPPVFDGPEDRNGRRNADEIAWVVRYLDGAAVRDDTGRTAPYADAPVVVAGDLNADPFDGDARREPLLALLGHARLQDPVPLGEGGAAAAAQGGFNDRHRGPPGADTADWNDERGPGNLRVDYVLPDATLDVLDAGVFWPAPGTEGAELVEVSDHRLIWVEVDWP
nr:endonuclease/exonuclease/phosphatase family protein [Roseobacter sp. HKCCA0434]